jgi:hypothetical protein
MAPKDTYGEKKVTQAILDLIPKKLHPALRGKRGRSSSGLDCIDFEPSCRVQKWYVEFIETKYTKPRFFVGNPLGKDWKERVLIAKEGRHIVALVAPVHMWGELT